MPMKINLGKKGSTVPVIISHTYHYTRLESSYVLLINGGHKVVLYAEKQIKDAWKYIENHCAKSKNCNEYFENLPAGKSLSGIMRNDILTIHRLAPIGKHDENDLPLGNCAGSDIGLSLYALQASIGNTPKLAATLLHEIAHYAGASTNPDGPGNMQAENSLIPCGLRHFFQKDATG